MRFEYHNYVHATEGGVLALFIVTGGCAVLAYAGVVASAIALDKTRPGGIAGSAEAPYQAQAATYGYPGPAPSQPYAYGYGMQQGQQYAHQSQPPMQQQYYPYIPPVGTAPMPTFTGEQLPSQNAQQTPTLGHISSAPNHLSTHEPNNNRTPQSSGAPEVAYK